MVNGMVQAFCTFQEGLSWRDGLRMDSLLFVYWKIRTRRCCLEGPWIHLQVLWPISLNLNLFILHRYQLLHHDNCPTHNIINYIHTKRTMCKLHHRIWRDLSVSFHISWEWENLHHMHNRQHRQAMVRNESGCRRQLSPGSWCLGVLLRRLPLWRRIPSYRDRTCLPSANYRKRLSWELCWAA